MRRRRPAATAPASTSVPPRIVTAAVDLTAAPMPSSIVAAACKASRTRMIEMLLNRSPTSFSILSSSSFGAWMAAIWLWGAASKVPGANIMAKSKRIDRQSIFRKEVILALISRPNMLSVKLSPSPIPKPRARLASIDISGGPL